METLKERLKQYQDLIENLLQISDKNIQNLLENAFSNTDNCCFWCKKSNWQTSDKTQIEEIKESIKEYQKFIESLLEITNQEFQNNMVNAFINADKCFWCKQSINQNKTEIEEGKKRIKECEKLFKILLEISDKEIQNNIINAIWKNGNCFWCKNLDGQNSIMIDTPTDNFNNLIQNKTIYTNDGSTMATNTLKIGCKRNLQNEGPIVLKSVRQDNLPQTQLHEQTNIFKRVNDTSLAEKGNIFGQVQTLNNNVEQEEFVQNQLPGQINIFGVIKDTSDPNIQTSSEYVQRVQADNNEIENESHELSNVSCGDNFDIVDKLNLLIREDNVGGFKDLLGPANEEFMGIAEDGLTILQRAVILEKFAFVQIILSALDNWMDEEQLDELKTADEYLMYYKSLIPGNEIELDTKQKDYINAKSITDGNTALFYAISSKNELITRMLLHYMADPNVKNLSKKSPKTIFNQHFKDNPDLKKYFSNRIKFWN